MSLLLPWGKLAGGSSGNADGGGERVNGGAQGSTDCDEATGGCKAARAARIRGGWHERLAATAAEWSAAEKQPMMGRQEQTMEKRQ